MQKRKEFLFYQKLNFLMKALDYYLQKIEIQMSYSPNQAGQNVQNINNRPIPTNNRLNNMQNDPDHDNSPVSHPSKLETYQITPTCMEICMMMPFPFCFVGCSPCLSRTSKFQFDTNTQLMRLKTYPGCMCCCFDNHEIRFADIKGLTFQPAGVRINRRSAQKLVMVASRGDIDLTGAKKQQEAFQLKVQLQRVMRKAGITTGRIF